MNHSVPVGVAAFDFDGTLVPGDSFIPFLLRLCGPRRLVHHFGASTLSLLAADGFRLDRDASKAALVARLLTGYPATRLDDEAETFGLSLRRRIRPWMRTTIDWHRGQGHRLVLVSASPAAYLEPFGRSLGFDAVLATRLEVDDDGRLTGRLVGANCRGREKEARLREWLAAHLGDSPFELWAYGDSPGDREMLAMADHPVSVSRRGVLRRPLQGALATQRHEGRQ